MDPLVPDRGIVVDGFRIGAISGCDQMVFTVFISPTANRQEFCVFGNLCKRWRRTLLSSGSLVVGLNCQICLFHQQMETA